MFVLIHRNGFGAVMVSLHWRKLFIYHYAFSHNTVVHVVVK